MNKSIPEKIHIIDSVGSGKTRLARMFSEKHAIQHYELDNVGVTTALLRRNGFQVISEDQFDNCVTVI
ncbi:hypothetical protein [Paraliobacillus sediminis]|uniref:hypothetical protein n=1 Tax=Paraliobacillus sediminis TaxID=1885916 RepID=UPI000E3B6675